MSETEQPLAESFSQTDPDITGATGLRVAASMAEGGTVSRDTNLIYENAATFGERLADRIVSCGGSFVAR